MCELVSISSKERLAIMLAKPRTSGHSRRKNGKRMSAPNPDGLGLQGMKIQQPQKAPNNNNNNSDDVLDLFGGVCFFCLCFCIKDDC